MGEIQGGKASRGSSVSIFVCLMTVGQSSAQIPRLLGRMFWEDGLFVCSAWLLDVVFVSSIRYHSCTVIPPNNHSLLDVLSKLLHDYVLAYTHVVSSRRLRMRWLVIVVCSSL